MKTYKIPQTDLVVSRMALGATPLATWDQELATDSMITGTERFVHAAHDRGITLFDTADVYGYGKAEAILGGVFKRSPGLRDQIVLQSKCGVRVSHPIDNPPLSDPHRFDFSYEHITRSVEGSLKRLNTDRLDILLLHRPDALAEPDEVAKALDELHRSGKVRYFGVSNHSGAQIELLKRSVSQPLVVNQVWVGLAHPHLITDGLDFNREGDRRFNKNSTGTTGTLEYCRLNGIQIQSWSPVRGLSKSTDPAIQATMKLATEIAKKWNVSAHVVALAWLLRHPAGIVPIVNGSTPNQVIENCMADEVTLTREEWYALLVTACGIPQLNIL